MEIRETHVVIQAVEGDEVGNIRGGREKKK
jgi:hypothetical protein